MEYGGSGSATHAEASGGGDCQCGLHRLGLSERQLVMHLPLHFLQRQGGGVDVLGHLVTLRKVIMWNTRRMPRGMWGQRYDLLDAVGSKEVTL